MSSPRFEATSTSDVSIISQWQHVLVLPVEIFQKLSGVTETKGGSETAADIFRLLERTKLILRGDLQLKSCELLLARSANACTHYYGCWL